MSASFLFFLHQLLIIFYHSTLTALSGKPASISFAEVLGLKSFELSFILVVSSLRFLTDLKPLALNEDLLFFTCITIYSTNKKEELFNSSFNFINFNFYASIESFSSFLSAVS